MNAYGNASNHETWTLRDAARERFGHEVVDGAMQRTITDVLGRCVSTVKDASPSMKICALLMAMCLVIGTSGGMAYIERTVDDFADGIGSEDAFYQNALPVLAQGTMHDVMRTHTGKNIVKVGPPIITGIMASGCAEDDEDDASSDIKEPGSYLIRKSNELFGMDPDAEDKVDAYLDSVLEEASGAPLFEVTSMAYIEEPGITSSGIIYPTQTPDIKDQYEHALNADKLAMDILIKYLNDADAGEESIKVFIDDDSFDIIHELKAKGITIENYAVTKGDHDNNGVMFVKNTFATKEKGSYDMSLNGHILMKLENKGDKDNPDWVPTEIIDHEVYTPGGDGGFRYLGSAPDTRGKIAHAWIEEEADIPLWCLIKDDLGKRILHVNDYRDEIMSYDVFADEPVNIYGREQKVHHHTGGRVIAMKNGRVTDLSFPGGDYQYDIAKTEDGELTVVNVNSVGRNYPIIEIYDTFIPRDPSDSSVSPLSDALAWKLEVAGGGELVKMSDGVDYIRRTVNPGDGIADRIGTLG